jgi:hypothetical protein
MAISNVVKKFLSTNNRSQFHQHFWVPMQSSFCADNFDALNGNSNWPKFVKIWCLVQKRNLEFAEEF